MKFRRKYITFSFTHILITTSTRGIQVAHSIREEVAWLLGALMKREIGKLGEELKGVKGNQFHLFHAQSVSALNWSPMNAGNRCMADQWLAVGLNKKASLVLGFDALSSVALKAVAFFFS